MHVKVKHSVFYTNNLETVFILVISVISLNDIIINSFGIFLKKFLNKHLNIN